MEQTLEQIAHWLEEQGAPRFRIDQVRTAWYTQPDWDAVTTLSKEMRAQLREKFPWLTVQPAGAILESKQDSTTKVILTLHDGQKIESVCMPNTRGDDKRTVCISSQVGCGMGCTFCATGKMGLIRNLTVDEIVDQVRFWRFQYPDLDISNIVFMGMGEPLANIDAVKAAANTFINDMEIGATRITVSTVGFPGGLERILKDETFPPVRVALSLHAGTEETRQSIVPSHGKRTMQTFANWVRDYTAAKGNRRHHVTLEYVMLAGVNDMPSEAKALCTLFQGVEGAIKLNLIPWNTTGGELSRSSQNAMEHFQRITQKAGITTTIRYSKGLDIDAACGQLLVKQGSIKTEQA